MWGNNQCTVALPLQARGSTLTAGLFYGYVVASPAKTGVNFRLDLRPDRAHRAGTTAARPTSPRPVWPMRQAMTSQTNPHG